ncbi:altronate dehydratase family protein [Caulobacter sp. 17J65-9]|uniref:UxaA family hydrolase n=1 Tax=Caulobacter sp. 17J65-9 TaxID=2709382 RepID=UPI0013C5826A|nr:altronate dehydratase family protein [Caulobacter sp. 17J65-9]NEX92742.1 altronate dehydratase [Caulobacter sp. 17J65-9]
MSASPALPSVHRVAPGDDVATALRPLEPGESVVVDGRQIEVRAAVPKGHKFAVNAVAAGTEVKKYGWPIGRATQAIRPGDHVHTHNLATGLSGVDAYAWTAPAPTTAPAVSTGEFLGYRRANGRVGTRNEIWILCTVGCVANTARRIADKAAQRFAGRVDGVHAFPHPFGCSQLGDDLSHTRKLIAALAAHPNAGGVLILGLGCENNQLAALLAEADVAPERLRAFNTQLADDEIEDGLYAVEALVAVAEQDRREACALSDLVIGLKCGGSDGFSGLTANPLVGRIADRVAEAGGTPVLTEIPEIFGAERLLMARAADRAVFDGVVEVVNDFKRYFLDHGEPVSENPSPGNVEGGITTLEEKSLGAVQKAGAAPLTQVLRYGERISRPGLALLEAPGNDAVSSTALTAAGATVILFTTGRGTPLGFPAPTLKIASNTALAERKPRWIDFDAGSVLADGLEAATDALMALVIDTASGRETRAEANGEREIAVWKQGVTL